MNEGLRGYNPEEAVTPEAAKEPAEEELDFSELAGPTTAEFRQMGLNWQEIINCLILIAEHSIQQLEQKGEQTVLTDKEIVQISALVEIQSEAIQLAYREPSQDSVSFQRLDDCILALQGFGVPQSVFSPDTILKIREIAARTEAMPKPREQMDTEEARAKIGAEIAQDNEADFWEEADRRAAERLKDGQ